MTNDPHIQMEKEWRSLIVSKLDTLDSDLKSLASRLEGVSPKIVDDHENRIRRLETSWSKAIGIMISIQVVMSVLLAVALKLLEIFR